MCTYFIDSSVVVVVAILDINHSCVTTLVFYFFALTRSLLLFFRNVDVNPLHLSRIVLNVPLKIGVLSFAVSTTFSRNSLLSLVPSAKV